MADENNFNPGVPANDSRLTQLRTLVHSIAISIFILAGTVSIFIYREAELLSRENQQLIEFVAEQGNTQEVIDDMRLKLGQYTQQHPDFAPIYFRYFGSNQVARSQGPTPIPNAAQPSPAASSRASTNKTGVR